MTFVHWVSQKPSFRLFRLIKGIPSFNEEVIILEEGETQITLELNCFLFFLTSLPDLGFK